MRAIRFSRSWTCSELVPSLSGVAGQTLDLIFPPSCVFCSVPLMDARSAPHLCSACEGEFCELPGPLCPRCASPVGQAPAGDRCPRCWNRQYYFDSTLTLGLYRNSLRVAIRRTKRPQHEALTRALGLLLARQVRNGCGGTLPTAVVPVPMHWWRRVQRGGNGAEVLAEVVGRQLGVPVWSGLLATCRRTRKQGMLPPSERFENVRHAFRIRTGRDVTHADLLLVDDVMTTGATASEVARVLRKAGARRVRVAVVGRGVGTRQA